MKFFFSILAVLIATNAYGLDFEGKFIQGSFILGKIDPGSEIIIDEQKVRVSSNGFFVFGLDRDRKFDITFTVIKDGQVGTQNLKMRVVVKVTMFLTKWIK